MVIDKQSGEQKWRTIATAKRQSVVALIPEQWQIDVDALRLQDDTDLTGSFLDRFLSPTENTITQSSAVGIVAKVSSGTWTSVEVIQAFAHRASLAHQFLPCLHEINFEDAYKEAQRLDEYYATHKKTIGPLHGLPVSLKDQFHVRGLDTSMGYVGWLDTYEGKPMTDKSTVPESELVKELRALGALIFCKTSVPQTLMAGETFNNIIGYLWNPRSRKLTSCGSSGGEAVLLSMKGSPLGFGTDIAGSIRVPALFNGLYGLRPSSGRLPYQGVANSMPGQNSAPSTVGPFTSNAADLRLAMQSVLSQEPWLHDPMVPPLPWREDLVTQIENKARRQGGEHLTIGVMLNDGVVSPFPAMQRVLKVVSERLESEGHETWLFDGGNDIHRAFGLSGEEIAPQIQGIYGTEARPAMTGVQIADYNLMQRDLRKQFLDMWLGTSRKTKSGKPIDAILSPTAANNAGTPLMHAHLVYSLWPSFYDCTACAVPVGQTDRVIDVYGEHSPSFGEADDKVRATYNAELFHGSPAGVQVVGRRLEEEKVITLVEYIADLLHSGKKLGSQP